MELFGEHSFSVRDQGPAEGRARFQASSASAPNWGLRRFRFSGSIVIVQIYDIPRPCRDTGPPYKAGFVFLGFVLRVGRIASPRFPLVREFASTRQCRCPRYLSIMILIVSAHESCLACFSSTISRQG